MNAPMLGVTVTTLPPPPNTPTGIATADSLENITSLLSNFVFQQQWLHHYIGLSPELPQHHFCGSMSTMAYHVTICITG